MVAIVVSGRPGTRGRPGILVVLVVLVVMVALIVLVVVLVVVVVVVVLPRRAVFHCLGIYVGTTESAPHRFFLIQASMIDPL